MNEFYMEQLVPRKTPVKKDALIKNICLVVTLIMLGLTILLGAIFLVGAIIMIAIDVMLIKNSSVEYEYLYLNGDLDIDKVIAKQKRKHAYSVNMENVIMVAPVDSAEMRPFQNVKVADYSSGDGSTHVYKMVLTKNGEKEAILIEPNKELLNGMRMIAPRKVIV